MTPSRGPRLDEVMVIALAADRVARAVAIDEVGRPVREAVQRWARPGASIHGRRLRELVTQLVHCSVCLGWWTSLAVSIVWPGRMRLRRGVAVAGMQVMLTLTERLVSEQGRAAIHHADRLQVRQGA